MPLDCLAQQSVDNQRILKHVEAFSEALATQARHKHLHKSVPKGYYSRCKSLGVMNARTVSGTQSTSLRRLTPSSRNMDSLPPAPDSSSALSSSTTQQAPNTVSSSSCSSIDCFTPQNTTPKAPHPSNSGKGSIVAPMLVLSPLWQRPENLSRDGMGRETSAQRDARVDCTSVTRRSGGGDRGAA